MHCAAPLPAGCRDNSRERRKTRPEALTGSPFRLQLLHALVLRSLLVLRGLVLRALLEHLLLNVLVMRALLAQRALSAGNWCGRWQRLGVGLPDCAGNCRWLPTSAACNAGSAPELEMLLSGLLAPSLLAPSLLHPHGPP